MSTAAGLPETIEGVQIIGIDCAAQPSDFGLARGRIRGGRLEVVEVTKGVGKDNCFADLANQVQRWIAGGDADPPARTLIALDAPLGWPIHMTRTLHDHRAGASLAHPYEDDPGERNPGNHLFRRHTDRFLAEKFPGAPLDIGADRIARVARSALELLGGLGTTEDGQRPVPLLWDPKDRERLAAIEVYPRLTLRHLRGGTDEAEIHYKGTAKTSPAHPENRRKIVEDLLRTGLTLNTDHLRKKTDPADYDHDLIDAVLCVFEGLHFLLGESVGPDHETVTSWLAERLDSVPEMSATDLATREGWIWFHGRLLAGSK